MARVFGPHVDLGMGFGSGRDGVAETHMPVGGGVIRRGQHVHASDGPIGQVRGLVADPRQHQVSDILLDEGHLWDKKEVVVPIDAVKFVIDDGVHLKLTRREVGALPPADLSRLA